MQLGDAMRESSIRGRAIVVALFAVGCASEGELIEPEGAVGLGGLETTEAGGEATFSLRLVVRPSSAVVLPLSSSDATLAADDAVAARRVRARICEKSLFMFTVLSTRSGSDLIPVGLATRPGSAPSCPCRTRSDR